MALHLFHPAVRAWFEKRFGEPTECQAGAWPSIRAGKHTLVAAPTGSGKTLAAFLAALDDLVARSASGDLQDLTHVVYVSPLKALSNDIQRNLQEPLEGIQAELRSAGLPEAPIRVLVRTGDTPAADREGMKRRPPHIVVTTPESLFILLTSEGGRKILRTTRSVIVDEIHAVVGAKRGSHLALSLERLAALAPPGLVRIGLSATQNPIEEVARFLVGSEGIDAGRTAGPGTRGEGSTSGSDHASERPHSSRCTIVDLGHARRLDVAIEVPGSPLQAVMSGEVWNEMYDRLATLIRQHRTTLVFVNTRRMSERVARQLGERLGAEAVASHHGSLAREQRLAAEQRLKSGQLRALVATASLELGIDIGTVDLVCQIGSTRSISTLMQRVGRSGHKVGGFPKGRIFPTSRDELVDAAALLDSLRRRELDRLSIPDRPLDILAQQIVAAVACEEWTEDDLFDLARRAWPYRDLPRGEFDAVVKMLADGFTTRRGRRGVLVHHDAVNRRLRDRRGARLAAITSGGAIPDTADYEVVLEPTGARVGTVNEDFAIESSAGDIFQLGNTSWRILRVEAGRVRVEDARGQPPTIPFWLGEAPARTAELSASVSRLRSEIEARLVKAPGPELAFEWLTREVGVSPEAAGQIVDYLAAARAALGFLPTQRTILMERFFDETGGMQLVVHSPFGSRINKAWGLALRKRFCRRFNFELQAAATEDAIVLSLGQVQSFPLDEVAHYLSSASVREVLVQALLDAPMFTVRWRWNAARALAVLRWRGGRKVAPPLQRFDAEDLLAAVFPDQLACVENTGGRVEIPDHPLVGQTIRDCLEEAMDVRGLEELLASIERGERRIVARDLTEPSPLAQEVLNARPYAFLDDAPLEERRTQAVISRRWLDPASASDLGALDAAAIERVRLEVWPEVGSADELHEALSWLGYVTEAEGRAGNIAARDTDPNRSVGDGPSLARTPHGQDRSSGGEGESWEPLLETLIAEQRAARLACRGGILWVAAERLPQIRPAFPGAALEPPISPPASLADRAWTSDEALAEIFRGRLDGLGPVTARTLASSAGLASGAVDGALARLETEGFAIRGRFTPGAAETEWCARRLLARVHRYTINRLRSEIEPVAASDFIRFLLSWQRLLPDGHADGIDALAAVVEQLEGFEAPAAAWESEILPARMKRYDPAWLDALCLSGRIAWARLTPGRPGHRAGGAGPVRTTPIALLLRRNLPRWTTIFALPDAVIDERRGASSRGRPGAGGSSGEEDQAPEAAAEDGPDLPGSARAVLGRLREGGAAFFEELVRGTGLLRPQVEEALAQLVARGLAASDGFTGLRALLKPSSRRPRAGSRRRHAGSPSLGMEGAGRWAVIERGASTERASRRPGFEPAMEMLAWTLLRRYGVVFRKLMDREGVPVPWRELLREYRRLEARGEIRGGRFVAGFWGEQFALPEAVGLLRSIRRAKRGGDLVSVSAADPLNLVGILTPGGRIPSTPSNRLLFRNGEPIGIRDAGEVRFLVDLDPSSEWHSRKVLLRTGAPTPFRAREGRTAG